MTGPLKWHGGKFYLAAKLIKEMPPHLHYVEPYFGGGAMLFAKNPHGVSEVINDRNAELTNFWRVLQRAGTFDRFSRIVEAIPFSENEWEQSQWPLSRCGVPSVTRAVNFFVRCRQSLAGRLDSFASISRTRTRRDMNEQVSAWLASVEGLPMVHTRLRRVLVLNRCALRVIKSEDGKETFFYLDPPYLPEERVAPKVYEHEMTYEDHEDLLKLLLDVRGRFMLSGYKSDLYDNYAAVGGWRRKDYDLPNNAAGGKAKRRMVECVYMNYWPSGEWLKCSS